MTQVSIEEIRRTKALQNGWAEQKANSTLSSWKLWAEGFCLPAGKA